MFSEDLREVFKYSVPLSMHSGLWFGFYDGYKPFSVDSRNIVMETLKIDNNKKGNLQPFVPIDISKLVDLNL